MSRTATDRPVRAAARVSARRVLFTASLKMFFRNKHSIFWTMLLPLIILGVFALLGLGGGSLPQVGVVDEVRSPASAALVHRLQASDLVHTLAGDAAAERSALDSGDRDLLLVLRPGAPGAPPRIVELLDGARSREAQTAQAVTLAILQEQGGAPASAGGYAITATTVNSRANDYTAFLVPGIIALSVMQTGLFTVLYSFVHLRQRGILRRLKATPLRPGDFLAAQVATRLVLAALQTALLLLIGVLIFRIHLYGSIVELVAVAVLGAAVFLALGFAISGSTGSVESAAPIANLVGLPMIVLSGVFFSRGGMPDWLHRITDLLPLTYLVDGLRHISYDGSGLLDIRTDLLGMAVWLVVAAVLAVRLFRWELA